MKATNGGIGMTDDEVKSFIARFVFLLLIDRDELLKGTNYRYMPGYELYLDSIERKDCRWSGKGLKLIIGKDRSVVEQESF